MKETSLFISGNDATRVIRASRTGACPTLEQPPTSIIVPSPRRALSNPQMAESLLKHLHHPEDEPLIVRTPSGDERPRIPGITSRVTSWPLDPELVRCLPEYALPTTDADGSTLTKLLLDSPLMDLLMLAAESDLHATAGSEQRRRADILIIDRICEYCGTYSLDPFQPNTREATYRLKPLLTLDQIRSFLERGGGKAHRGGFERLRIASKYAVERSASPSETLAAIALGAMPRLGGFHLPGMVVNQPLDLDAFSCDQELLYHSQLTPDFYFPDIKFSLEIQGAVHKQASSCAEDERREHDYELLGIEAIFTEAAEYATPSGISGLALEVAARIDQANNNENQVHRVKRLMKDEGFKYCQRLLFDTLFNSRT